MTGTDLDRLEQGLGVTLPATYRALMCSYPFAEDHPAAENWLVPDPDRVLSLQFGGYRTRNGPAPWPTHYVVVGNDGGEEAYVLDVSRDPSPVLVFELETGHFRSLAPDLDGFLALIREWHAEIVADQEAMESRLYAPPGPSWWRRLWR
jgi:hypothetical protein